MERTALRRLAIQRGYVCPSCAATRQPFLRKFHASPFRRRRDGTHVLEVLEERGLVNQIAGNRAALSKILSQRKVSIYAGIDPTAPSLHLGHLLPLMVLFWLHNYGHSVISLVGGATARVGDPSGRLTSRAVVDLKESTSNTGKMWRQTHNLWQSVEAYRKRHGFGEGGERQMLDNSNWLNRLKAVEFLSVLGTGARLGTMLGRDTVRNKMEKGDGMSFAELAYPLLQAWDWWHMYKTYGTQVQIGGADQYGNIIAGMDAVRSISQNEGCGVLEQEKGSREPMGLTVPLLTTSSGEKFGKSAGNAIWLNIKMTSAFDLYGFLLKTADADVERYLKLFSFVPLSKIAAIMDEHSADQGKRKAQHLLAAEVLELVHGPRVAARTASEHEEMRKPTLESLMRAKRLQREVKQAEEEEKHDDPVDVPSASSGEVQGVAAEATPQLRVPRGRKSDPRPDPATEDGIQEFPGLNEQHTILPESRILGLPFPTVLRNAGLASSKSEAARMIAAGGVYVARKASRDGRAGDSEEGHLDGEGEEGSDELEFVPLKTLPEGTEVGGLLIESQLVLRLGKWKVRVVEVVEEELMSGDLFRV